MMITGSDGKAILENLEQFQSGLTWHADVGNQHLGCFGAQVKLCQRFGCRSKAAERDLFAG
jgi:hypothetical protein